jgi:hypothetical protein
MSSNKQAKRAAASKQKKKAANIERAKTQQQLGRRQEQQDRRSPQAKAARNARVGYAVATKGVIDTAKELQKDPEFAKTKIKALTNIEVLTGINEMIPVLGGVHGGIEIVTRLSDMKKYDILPHQAEMIEAFDRKVISISEDIHAMYEFINAEKQVEDYMPIFIHYIDTLADVVQFAIPELMEGLLQPIEALINEYVNEHKAEGEHSSAFGARVSDERIVRIAPEYRTMRPLEDFLPDADAEGEAEPTPLVGELQKVDEAGALEASLAKEIL